MVLRVVRGLFKYGHILTFKPPRSGYGTGVHIHHFYDVRVRDNVSLYESLQRENIRGAEVHVYTLASPYTARLDTFLR